MARTIKAVKEAAAAAMEGEAAIKVRVAEAAAVVDKAVARAMRAAAGKAAPREDKAAAAATCLARRIPTTMVI